MKKTIIVGTLLVASIAAIAGTATLAWNLSTSPNIAKQTFFTGVVAGSYTNSVTLPANATQYQATNLVPGATYHFAVTCTDSNGLQSAFSPEAVYTVPIPPPVPPTNLHVVGP